jgi:aryl-alcohol dehydrogenase-like predicted oxidoreductase
VGALANPGGPFDRVARNRQATPHQIALAWLLRRSPAILLIPGTASAQHLEENVQGAMTQLTDTEYDAISLYSEG